MSAQDTVQLNIGGQLFCTSKSTLTCGTSQVLANLVENGSNNYFIDRDATYFCYILNFLRDGCVILPNESKCLHKLFQEAKYYQIEELCIEIQRLISASETKNRPKYDVLILRRRRDSVVIFLEGPMEVHDSMVSNLSSLNTGVFIVRKCVKNPDYAEWKLFSSRAGSAGESISSLLHYLSNKCNYFLKCTAVSSQDGEELFVLAKQ
jgi:hypothetical protein